MIDVMVKLKTCQNHIYIYIYDLLSILKKALYVSSRNDADLVAVRHGCSFTGVFQLSDNSKIFRLSDNVTSLNLEALKKCLQFNQMRSPFLCLQKIH